MGTTNVVAQELRTNYFYLGLDVGASVPALKFFRDQETDTISRLTKSKMFGASIGYSFYPGMMIEFAITHQPSYDLSYEIPGKNLLFEENLHGSIRAKIQSFFGNIVYQMPAKTFGLKPYVMVGVGIAKVTTTPVAIAVPGYPDFIIFAMDKNKGRYFTYHLGAGVNRDISKHIAVDFALKVQAISKVKSKYQSFNYELDQLVTDSKKKTVIAGQFTIGLKINL
ncbi:MAG: outer membrane beta-barrel protein [Rickettsiaceae bacterium]|nr:outer membrane beta-barrel protein [Rickettsiaceae bacterium]